MIKCRKGRTLMTNKIFRPKLRSCCSKLWKEASRNDFVFCKCSPLVFILYSLAPRHLQNIHRFSISLLQWVLNILSSIQPPPHHHRPLPLRESNQSLPPPHLGQASLSSHSFPKHEPSPSKSSSSPSWPLPLRA